jgi:transposase
LPKLWIVERTFGWLNRRRRLAKDVENRIRAHLALIQIAMMRRIAKHQAH